MKIVNKKDDPRTKIATHLKGKGIMQKWLAEKVDISPTQLHFILNRERDLSDELRGKINAALETNF